MPVITSETDEVKRRNRECQIYFEMIKWHRIKSVQVKEDIKDYCKDYLEKIIKDKLSK